jgi:hypothetical protein
MELEMLAEVRELLDDLPHRSGARTHGGALRSTWPKAANGGDLSDISVALRLVFLREGIECR